MAPSSACACGSGALPGLPYVLHRPIPDNWGRPSRLQPHPPRLVMIKRLRAY